MAQVLSGESSLLPTFPLSGHNELSCQRARPCYCVFITYTGSANAPHKSKRMGFGRLREKKNAIA